MAAILFTQIVRLPDKKAIVSAETPGSGNFERTHGEILSDMVSIVEGFSNEPQFCTAKSSKEGIRIHFKQFGKLLIISAVSLGVSKTSVSLYFERLQEVFFEEYGQDIQREGAYIRFEKTIQEESLKYSKDRNLEETMDTLQETKEVCIKNYTHVLQRGHKIEHLEMLGNKLQHISETYRKRSRKMHILEAVAAQYLFYAVLIVFLILFFYFFRG